MIAHCKVFKNDEYVGMLSFRKVNRMKKSYMDKAIEVQKETKSDHVIYYYDERNEKGAIETIRLYDPLICDDEYFQKKVVPFNSFGIFGVIHKK
jgi:hypothetical protein